MEASGLHPSQWWKPANMNRDFLLQHAEPDEFFVVLCGGKPAASMVLQETERNQSWKAVDGLSPKSALYIHWLCVHRNFASTGLPRHMVTFAQQEATRRRFSRLRLDTNAGVQKLCDLYIQLGFTLIGEELVRNSKTAFFE